MMRDRFAAGKPIPVRRTGIATLFIWGPRAACATESCEVGATFETFNGLV
jgi:hypothetical protein